MWESIKDLKRSLKRIERRRGGRHIIKRITNRTTCGMNKCDGTEDAGAVRGSAVFVCLGCRVAFCRSTHCLNAHLQGVQGTTAKKKNPLTVSENQGEVLSIPLRGNRSDE